jgi:DNA-directed RNA polymerase subunit E'/Rpb7
VQLVFIARAHRVVEGQVQVCVQVGVKVRLSDGRDLLEAAFANWLVKLAGDLSQSYPLGWEDGRWRA